MKTYTIKEVATISGLPDSTLRYYERIGLVDSVARDESSKHRVYNQNDVDRITMIACLNATGMPIENMRTYMSNRLVGSEKAVEQADILRQRKSQIDEEINKLQLRAKYVEAKIAFWEAVEDGNTEEIKKCATDTYAIAEEMKLPKPSGSSD